jgi:hypothetical protein
MRADVNRDNELSYPEFVKFIKELQLNIRDKEIFSLQQELDQNHDHKINLEEILAKAPDLLKKMCVWQSQYSVMVVFAMVATGGGEGWLPCPPGGNLRDQSSAVRQRLYETIPCVFDRYEGIEPSGYDWCMMYDENGNEFYYNKRTSKRTGGTD